MKTFKQFMENLSLAPKMYDAVPVTIDDAITNRIRTLDVIDKSNRKFRKDTGFNLPLPQNWALASLVFSFLLACNLPARLKKSSSSSPGLCE